MMVVEDGRSEGEGRERGKGGGVKFRSYLNIFCKYKCLDLRNVRRSGLFLPGFCQVNKRMVSSWVLSGK